MREERVQRIAAFLSELFDAGSAQAQFTFEENEVLLPPSSSDWYDQLAHELRSEYEEDPKSAVHDWPLFVEHARHLVGMLYDA